MKALWISLGLWLFATGLAAQSWQPIGLSEPFPPHGTRICAEGNGDRICLLLYCNAPGDGLRIGWIDTTYPPGVQGLEIDLVVGGPTIVPDYGPFARLERLPTPPYFAAAGMMDADLAPAMLQKMKAGRQVYVHIGSDSIGLPLRGSSREISRAETLCGPPARPVAAAAPAPAPAPAAPPEPPRIPAQSVGSAAWNPVPPDPAETVYGTQLCHPAAPGGAATRCIALQCFTQGEAPTLFYTDAAVETTAQNWGAPYPLVLSRPSGARIDLDLDLRESERLTALPRGALDLNGLISVLSEDGVLRIDTPGGAVSLATTGFTAERDRLARLCALPTAAPAQTAAPPTTASAAPSATPPATPTGQVYSVAFGEDERAIADDTARAAMEVVHGANIAEYTRVVGQALTGWSPRLFDLGGGRALLFSQLCGGGGWFSKNGCLVYFHVNPGSGWQEVFSDGSLAFGGQIAVDTRSMRGGFPDVIIDDGAKTWIWDGAAYR